MTSHPLRRAAAAVVTAALLAAPGLASAGGETLKRSASNMLGAPLDLALSPITAGRVIYRNITTVDDTLAVRIAYPVPGYAWTTGLFMGASVLRFVAGFFELFPGMVLLFTDAEMDPLYDPAEKGEALWMDRETPVVNLRIGLDYTEVTY